MNATQGVILVMGAALVLWLMWSAQSPFSTSGSSVPNAGGIGGGTTGAIPPGMKRAPYFNPKNPQWVPIQ